MVVQEGKQKRKTEKENTSDHLEGRSSTCDFERKERSNAQQEQGGGGKRKYLAANCSSRVRKGILEEVREVYTARQLRLQEEPSGQRDVLLGCWSGGVVETRPRINTPAGSEREREREERVSEVVRRK